jgi:hypothetical protein
LSEVCLVWLFCNQNGLAQTPPNVWNTNGPGQTVYRTVVDPSDPEIIYATGPTGVYKSIDNGATWVTARLNVGGSLEIDPVEPMTLYLGTSYGLYRTTDGAENFYRTTCPLENIALVKVAPSDHRIIYALTDAENPTDNHMLVSVDAGVSWTRRPMPSAVLSAWFFEIDPHDANVLYTYQASWDDVVLSKSVDGGMAWSQFAIAGSVLPTWQIVIDRSDSRILYAATLYGVYKSTDGGNNWYRRGTPRPSASVSSIAIDPVVPGTLYAGSVIDGCCYTGVFKSTDDGSTWTEFNTGLNGLEIWQLAIDRSGRFLHAVNAPGNIFTVRLRDDPRVRSAFDFDGDGRADVSVFRPSDDNWYVDRSSQGFAATPFGLADDKITPADYDGDGKTDVAVYRDGTWYWLNSSDGSFRALQFGLVGDIPVPADRTGDGRADLGVYRGGSWYTLDTSNGQVNSLQFGLAADKPVVGDYDGDGRADEAVYRDGTWYLNRSTLGFAAISFGLPADKLVPADYDGDGKTDFAVYRDGTWYVLGSREGYSSLQFGLPSDVPSPADFDGDGRADPAVYRNGIWYLNQSTQGFASVQFGTGGDTPVPSTYVR